MVSQLINVADAYDSASTKAALIQEFQEVLPPEQQLTNPLARQKRQLKHLLDAQKQSVPVSDEYFRLVGQYNEILDSMIDNGLDKPLDDELLLDDDLLVDKYFEFKKQWDKAHPYTIEKFVEEKSAFICMVEILDIEAHTARAKVIRQYKGNLPSEIKFRFYVPWGLSKWYRSGEKTIVFLDKELISLGLSGRMPVIVKDKVEYAASYNENRDFWLDNASIEQDVLDDERVLLIELKLAEAIINRNEPQKSDAYQKYKSGRFYLNGFLNRFSKDSLDYLKKATKSFKDAIKLDKTFAKAHSGLAACYVVAGIYNIEPPEESFAKALKPAAKALEINNMLAEAHTSLAYSYMCYEWNWQAAEDEYKRAIEIDPDYALAHQGYAHLLGALKRFPEALEEIKRALEINPASPMSNVVYGFILYYKKDYEASWQQFIKAKTENPLFDATYYGIALACEPLALEYMKEGNSKAAETMFKEAKKAATIAVRVARGNPVKLATRAHVHALSGEEVKAQAELKQLIALSKKQYVSPFQLATIYTAMVTTRTALENQDLFIEYYKLALDYLEKAYETRDQWLVLLNVEPRFTILHEDERFKDLIRKLNFPAKHENKR